MDIEDENGDGYPDAPTYHKFFVAVFLLAAANSWSTVFSEAFTYYKPEKRGGRVLIAAALFALLLTIIAIAFARHTYNNPPKKA